MWRALQRSLSQQGIVRRLSSSSQEPARRVQQMNDYFSQYIEEYDEEVPSTSDAPTTVDKSPKREFHRKATTLAAVKETLEEGRASNVVCTELEGMPYAFAIICSPRNSRHSSAIVELLHKKFRTEGRLVRRLDKHWKTVDLRDIMVHIMPDEVRERYDLESLWAMGYDESDVSVDSIEDFLPSSALR